MKFIGINKTITFRKDEIIGVEHIEGSENCKVITTTGKYSCDWPYTSLMRMLDIEDQTPTDRGNLWGAQHWAG